MLTGDAAELAERVKGRHDADDPKIDWLVVHLLDAHHPVVHLGHLAEHPALRPIGAAAARSSSLARAGAAAPAAAVGAAGAAEAASPAAGAASAAAAPRAAGRDAHGALQPRGTRQIEAAITEAESKTSGEIIVVVATASAGYFAYALMWAALLGAARALAADLSHQLAGRAHLSRPARRLPPRRRCSSSGRRLRFAIVPKSIKRARAHQKAVEQFLAQNLHTTKGRTGVLIYVSFAEHYAEVIADEGIYKKVPQSTWNERGRTRSPRISARGSARRGFITAIETCGKILAEHFPPGRVDQNELPNHLIVLDGRWSA